MISCDLPKSNKKQHQPTTACIIYRSKESCPTYTLRCTPHLYRYHTVVRPACMHGTPKIQSRSYLKPHQWYHSQSRSIKFPYPICWPALRYNNYTNSYILNHPLISSACHPHHQLLLIDPNLFFMRHNYPMHRTLTDKSYTTESPIS